MRLMFQVVIFLFPLATFADGFLSASSLLGKAKIIPVQIGIQNSFLPLEGSEGDNDIYLITTSGLSKLVKTNGKKQKLQIRTCGADKLASPFKVQGGKDAQGIFAVIAPEKDLKIKWMPIKVVEQDKHACLDKTGFSVSKSNLGQVEGIAGLIYFVEYKKKSKKESSDIASCPLGAYQSVGIVDGDKCQAYLESEVDCDGYGYNKGQLSKPLGALEIVKGSSKEKWLIYNATGYEGDAFFGIKLGVEAEKERVDFYVYSGC